MNNAPLDGVEACVFDAYGTLFDFAAAARSSEDELGDQSDRLAPLWRDKQLQYTCLRVVWALLHTLAWKTQPPQFGQIARRSARA